MSENSRLYKVLLHSRGHHSNCWAWILEGVNRQVKTALNHVSRSTGVDDSG